MSIKLQSSLEEYLTQCSLYDSLESVIAVVHAQGGVRYANQAFLNFTNAVRDSVQNL
jgi:hypothetical protein